MERTQPFAEVLEAVARLSWDERETLVAIVQRRMAERGRKLLAADVQDARREFAEGLCRPSTADELMSDLVDDLIEHNPAFRALLEKSLASPREPFPFASAEEQQGSPHSSS